MVIGYDPVSRRIIVDCEDGQPPFEVPVTMLQLKYYGNETIISVLMDQSDVVVSVIPDEDEPYEAYLQPTAPGRWRLRFRPERR